MASKFIVGIKGQKSQRYLPTICRNLGEKKRLLACSTVLLSLRRKLRSKRSSPGGVPCNLNDKKTPLLASKQEQKSNKIQCTKRFIYPFSLNARSSTRVAPSAAITIKEGVTFQITWFYCVELSTRPSFGRSTTRHISVFLPRKPT